jgi:cytochrome c oxidase subunit 2
MHDAYIVFSILATLAAIGVSAAILVAVGRYRRRRGDAPVSRAAEGPRPGRLAGALALVVAVFFTAAVLFDQSSRDVPASLAGATQKPLTIRAAGQQWLWRYTYPDGTFSYYELVVPAGRTVKLNIDSTDAVHSWFVPELAGQAEAVPGRLNHVSFRADRPGTYNGQSTVLSGQGFAAMRIRVRALPESEFLAWLDTQKRDILTGQSAAAKALGEQSSPSAPSAPLTPGVSQAATR